MTIHNVLRLSALLVALVSALGLMSPERAEAMSKVINIALQILKLLSALA